MVKSGFWWCLETTSICIESTWIEMTLYGDDRKPYGGPPRIMTKPWCLFSISLFTFACFFFLKDCSYDEADATVSVPVPASPSISERTSPPPASPSRQAFLEDLFDFDEDVSVRQKLDVIIENQKALFKLFSSVIQERKDSMCHCNRPVSYSNGWTGSSMKWRLMQAN